MQTSSQAGNLRVAGQLTMGSIVLPPGSVSNTNLDLSLTDPIDAEKVEQQYAVDYRQTTGAIIVTQTQDVHIVHGASGEIVSVDITATTAPTGGDKKFTVDVMKGSAGVAFATVLTAPADYDDDQADREIVTASLVASPTLADGTILRVIITASGATGTQGQGLVVTITVRAKANP